MPSDPHPLDPPHRELLARAAAGEPDAFGAVYQTYQHVVYRFGYAMTGSRDAAEDIAQEVFVTLFREIARYDPSRASFTTYLYGIVRNMSRDRLRRERRFIPLDLIGLGAAAIHESDPFDAIDGAQAAAVVRRALRQLPARYRELIVLCDLHGLSYVDAARVVNISVAAVRSRLHRGRHLLRAACVGFVLVWSLLKPAPNVPSGALDTRPTTSTALATYAATASRVRPDVSDSPRRTASVSMARRTDLPSAMLLLSPDPVAALETLQLVRLRIPREALQALGLVLLEPETTGIVDVDVLVGEDGFPRDIRKVRVEPQ